MSEKLLELVKGAGDIVDAGISLGKAELIWRTPIGDKAAEMISNVIAKALDVETTGTLDGISVDKESWEDFVQDTIGAATLLETLGDDVAETVSEAISDAMSNIMYSGPIGLIDATLRVKYGGIPPQNPAYPNGVDTDWQAWHDAMSGYHYWALVLGKWSNEYTNIAQSIHDDHFTIGVIDTIRTVKKIDWFLVSRIGTLFEHALTRLYEAFVSALEVLFARVEDVAQEYRATELMYQNGAISVDEYNAVMAKLDAEISAAEQEVDAIITDFTNSLSELLNNWQIPDNLSTIEYKLKNAIDNLVRDVFNGVGAYAVRVWSLRDKNVLPTHVLRVTDEVGEEVSSKTIPTS